jgi:hypothetical protein
MSRRVTVNLIENWPGVDSYELRIILDKHFGGPGQYHDRAVHPNTLYLPLAGEAGKVALRFSGRDIERVEPGPALTEDEWRGIERDLNAIDSAPTVFGREFSFSSYRVHGWWRGERSQVRILPPPSDAPRADMENADHPFILEFPIRASDHWPLTNYRRIREHRDLTLLLNLVLAGSTSFSPRRPHHFWAGIRGPAGELEIKWVQEFFFAPLDQIVTDTASPPIGDSLPELPPERYYLEVVHDGRGLWIPSDLDDAILNYRGLSSENRARFDRAAFWMDMASREWQVSMSSSFAALVSAVEALTVRGELHQSWCEKCCAKRQHEEPGATERFRAFFESFAPGESLRKRRTEMYALRSGILHGTELMQSDRDQAFGWDPPWMRERELHEELWSLTRLAIRKWLKDAVNG